MKYIMLTGILCRYLCHVVALQYDGKARATGVIHAAEPVLDDGYFLHAAEPADWPSSFTHQSGISILRLADGRIAQIALRMHCT
jgi:hypothetical protein